MKVTVLLAVHNGGALLHEAVASVLSQTFTDFEFLLVDDASTDGALGSLPADSRIRVLVNERNLGQIPSLNRALREARGEYVARLDHDDLCLPRRLERQVELLERFPEVALTASWVDVVDEHGRLWTRSRPRVDSYVDFAARVATGRSELAHPSLMFRRDTVLAVGGYDEALGAAEDQELYRRLVLAGEQARVVPEVLVLYRRHEGQMTYAKAALVQENDARSHERFLAALAPDAPVRSLRLLFTCDPLFWSEAGLATGDLDRFLAAASERLGFDALARAAFAQALARSAADSLLAGWMWGAGAYARRSAPVALFARRYGDARTRIVTAVRPLLLAVSPLGPSVVTARSRLRQLLRSSALLRLRMLARRSRALRWFYSRAVETRSTGN